MEPIRWGMPTIIGPGYKNFEDLVTPLLTSKLIQVVSSEDLAGAVIDSLYSTPLRPVVGSDRFVKLPECLTGALDKTWNIIKDTLPIPQ